MALVLVMFMLPPGLWFASILSLGLAGWEDRLILLIQGAHLGYIPYCSIFVFIVYRLVLRWIRPVYALETGQDSSPEILDQARKNIYLLPIRLLIAQLINCSMGAISSLIGVWPFTGNTPPMAE